MRNEVSSVSLCADLVQAVAVLHTCTSESNARCLLLTLLQDGTCARCRCSLPLSRCCWQCTTTTLYHYHQVLQYRDVVEFLKLSDAERQCIFKAPAAEVAAIVSVFALVMLTCSHIVWACCLKTVLLCVHD